MTLLASHTLPCLGRTFFLTEGTRQLSRASVSPFPCYQCLPCMQQPQLITIFHLPPVPTEPLSLPASPLLLLCLYSLQTLCRKPPVVHLCVIIAVHMPYPEVVFHSSSPHLPGLVSPPTSSTTVSGSCMGWYRCYTFG